MAVATRSFSEFDPSMEDWNSYSERFDLFLDANAINDPRQKLSLLLSSIGPSTYKLVRNLCCPDLPKSRTYKDIIELLKNHYRPKPVIAVERLKFHSTVRQPSESVASYIARLRELSEYCEFGDLEEMLRDRLICGINNTRIQKLLLTDANLTFKRAQELAESAEAAEKNVHDVGSATTVQTQVNVVSSNSRRRPSTPTNKLQGQDKSTNCYRCGGADHHHTRCRFRESACHYCKKKGHISRVCRKRLRRTELSQQTNVIKESTQPQAHPPTSRAGSPELVEQAVNSVSTPTDSGCYPETLFAVTGPRLSGPLNVQVALDGKQISMQVDTGAAATLISEESYSALWETPPPLRSCATTLKTYTGEEVPLVGIIHTQAV